MGATNSVHKRMMKMRGGDAKQTDSERAAPAISVVNWPERWDQRRCHAGTRDCTL